MKHVEVIRESDSRLKRDVWRFWYLDSAHALRISEFSQQARPSTRHKFRSHVSWSRYDKRRNTLENPPLPEDVRAEAIEKFTADLVVDVL